jgi:hypothetical protein
MKRPRWMPVWNETDATVFGLTCVFCLAPKSLENRALVWVAGLYLLANTLRIIDLRIVGKKEAEKAWKW